MGGDVALALQKELRDVLLAVPCRDVQGGVAPRAEEAEAGAVVQECHAGLAVPELRGKVQRSRREGLGVLPVDLEPVHVEQVGALGCLPRLCRPVQRVLGDQLKAGNEALDKPAAAQDEPREVALGEGRGAAPDVFVAQLPGLSLRKVRLLQGRRGRALLLLDLAHPLQPKLEHGEDVRRLQLQLSRDVEYPPGKL